jgi:hypothetical protein
MIPRNCLRFAVVAIALGNMGCYAVGELGYVNTAKPVDAFGATVAGRLGLGLVHEGPTTLEFAFRGDLASSQSRFALGPSALFTLQSRESWSKRCTPTVAGPCTFRVDHSWSPYLRPGVWLHPVRKGTAEDASWISPSLDLGALFWPGSQLVFTGVRAEYASHPDGFRDSMIWAVYVGYGWQHQMHIDVGRWGH